MLRHGYSQPVTNLYPCDPDCTTVRIHYNVAPPVGGWGLINWQNVWSYAAGATNITATYADYTTPTFFTPGGPSKYVLGSGDNASMPFVIDYSTPRQGAAITPVTPVDSVGYVFIPCTGGCATIRVYYNMAPPAGGWGLVNWDNNQPWSAAANPFNIHATYADYTIQSGHVPTGVEQLILLDGDNFSSPFTIDFANREYLKTAPVVSSVTALPEPVTVDASLSVSASFTDEQIADVHTAVWDWGDGNVTTGIVTEVDGSGSVSNTHTYSAPGTYTVILTVIDNDGLVGTNTTIVNVTNNQAPVLEAIGNKAVNEGAVLQFTLSASDPDGDNLTHSVANLPAGATFDSQTATFSWTPDFNQEGNYENIEFTVTDDGIPMELDTELITITVGGVNRAPEFDPTVSPQEVIENVQLNFSVQATDPDEDSVTLSVTNLPSGASFNTLTGAFSWTPTLSQSGHYIVTFNATDDGSPVEIGTIDVVITVGDDPTPTEQSDDLNTTVIEYNLPNNVENSYLSNLKKVTIFIEGGQIQAAINQLNAFISKVQSDYSNSTITQTVRDDLVGKAQALLADLQ